VGELVHHPDRVKLGKAPAREDPRTLKLAHYLLEEALPPPPQRTLRRKKVSDWPMYGNDQYGDCVFAGAGHEIQLWTAMGGKMVEVPTDAILKAYSAVTGFDPSRPETDRGTVVLDALNFRRRTGIAGHLIGAYAQVDPKNSVQMKHAIDLFGAVGIGLNLPLSAQQHDNWNYIVTDSPGSWGGHYIPLVDYDTRGYYGVTWGKTIRVGQPFLDACCDEAYALLSPDELKAGRGPHHLDISQLNSDLSHLG
jgi:hypothetical protein